MSKIIITIDDEDILELIPTYLEGRREEVDILRDAAERKDFISVRDIGHKLRGSGGGFGFDRISEIGQDLEASAKAQDLPSVIQNIALLQDYLERVEVVGA